MQGLASVLAGIPLAALLIGPDQRIAATNPAALDLLGQGIGGRHFLTALRQPDVLTAIESTLRDHAPRRTGYQASDSGRDSSFVVHVAYIDTPESHGVLVCFEDMTEREQAAQMRRDFVANVSHELRTPLTALMGFIETLQGPARRDDKAIDRFLGIMQTEAARMERLVRDLLSLSRVESEERVRPREPVDLSGTIGSVLYMLRPMARERGCEIAFDPVEGIEVPGNADQLQQVFTNLVENAIKYGGAGNHITITIETLDKDVTLRAPGVAVRVRDRGPGIDPLHIPRLTERFYRVDTHRSREMGGTGLGLAIVKHIVNRHRGRLRISSTPGEGSEFMVILPRWTASQG
ncbi:two-component system, OmpR family, phosphate regulon sensor histidine kinase PhoR [Roseovarius azorensis]|uniref:histidine kinase n=1 Tax=Roseovarius azorensis TaxID=1287727 RepID=A0A1H7VFV5_9RHOB|nr:ATP-binding protein [Roseovarius azorensis]SEM08162.1 two-component system, OmpR family, phosphate regulon sensor histidine kinase PhoR [Roseovarius azorensis]